MARIYAELILAGIKTFSQVPDIIKNSVDDVLKECVAQGKITKEQYEEFVGKPYVK